MAGTKHTYATLGHFVRRASQLHDRYFEEFGSTDVTARQFALLIALEREPEIGQIELANLIAIDRTTVGGMVQRLEARDYITRVRDSRDARRNVLALTPEGKRLIRRLEARIPDINEALLAPLTPAEREVFIPLLTKVAVVEDAAFPGYRKKVVAALPPELRCAVESGHT